MLPAPPSSCAGWWFSRLWQALLAQRPEEYAGWAIHYPEPGELRLNLRGPETAFERIVGSYHEGAERRMITAWEWPGEDGMVHVSRALWQPGEVVVRPLEWLRQRRSYPALNGETSAVPWPLRVRIHVRAWHNQTLDRADIEATDGGISYPVEWPPSGEATLPRTELPCGLTTLRQHGERASVPGAPAIILAGLTLPWRVDLDRETWPIWRRLGGGELLDFLGGPRGLCPRHGRSCPWPATGHATPAR